MENNSRTITLFACLCSMFIFGCGLPEGPTGTTKSAITCAPNGVKDGEETDVDCGGPCPTKCVNGKTCATGTDCASGICTNTVCVVVNTSCTNNMKDGQETDVDCGNGCPPCVNGKVCTKGADCASGLCQNNLCIAVPVSCSDLVQNGNETDIDCGGSCKACANGQHCKAPGDCVSGNCSNSTCAPPVPQSSCNDGQKNGVETDIDCGGNCPSKCGDGKNCATGTDCQSGVCTNQTCIAVPKPASCSDGITNGQETDIDCGGNCNKCSDSKSCRVNSDCQSDFCFDGSCRQKPAGPSCINAMKDGAETDIDCGGPVCAKCGDNRVCVGATDCTSGFCVNGFCKAPPNCFDGVKNGQETDIDCGNGCAKCALGKACLSAFDCQSGTCTGGACAIPPVQPTCQDGIRNGNETDVDCGGNCAFKCSDGRQCSVGGDCASGLCSNGVCRQPVPACGNGVKDPGETDVDCGGSCPVKCANGKACSGNGDCASNFCQNGICANSPVPPAKPACDDGIKNGAETDIDCGGPICWACGQNRSCLGHDDCWSGNCVNLKCVAAPSCSDGIQNGTETDVDCGGNCATKCGDGRKCVGDTDCTNGYFCSNLVCRVKVVLPSCSDGLKNGTETDIDCGGGCARCGDNKSCIVNADCLSTNCVSGRCAAVSPVGPSCSDNMKNGNETDVDCGGSCPKCQNGKACFFPVDCVSAYCFNYSCQAAPPGANCTDNVRNGNETDIDCGGNACPKCGDNKSCTQGSDCTSGSCAAGKCQPGQQPNTCNDGIRNGAETDIDCGGGVCPKCGLNARCLINADCSINYSCSNGICINVPQQQSCQDGVRNGNETDVDCGGGTCNKCVDGKVCSNNTDCAGNNCQAGVCRQTSCYDGVRNGAETDTDCGGGVCPKCATNFVCSNNNDCVSGNCYQSRCAAAVSCGNQVRDGNETDIDCGGGTCSACIAGKRCNFNTDCQSSNCTNGFCGAGGASCSNGVKDGNETDVDCGGSCTKCSDGKACAGSGDCASGLCSSNKCTPLGGQKPNGSACSGSGECLSGLCQNNVCTALGGGGGAGQQTYKQHLVATAALKAKYPNGGWVCWDHIPVTRFGGGGFSDPDMPFTMGVPDVQGPPVGVFVDCAVVSSAGNIGTEVNVNAYVNQACSVLNWVSDSYTTTQFGTFRPKYCTISKPGANLAKLRFVY